MDLYLCKKLKDKLVVFCKVSNCNIHWYELFFVKINLLNHNFFILANFESDYFNGFFLFIFYNFTVAKENLNLQDILQLTS